MSTETASIYMRQIQLEVVIPEKHVWIFMGKFGVKFSVSSTDGSSHIQRVDSYFDHPNGWHVVVTVHDKREKEFYEFLRNFCEARQIEFEEPK